MRSAGKRRFCYLSFKPLTRTPSRGSDSQRGLPFCISATRTRRDEDHFVSAAAPALPAGKNTPASWQSGHGGMRALDLRRPPSLIYPAPRDRHSRLGKARCWPALRYALCAGDRQQFRRAARRPSAQQAKRSGYHRTVPVLVLPVLCPLRRARTGAAL